MTFMLQFAVRGSFAYAPAPSGTSEHEWRILAEAVLNAEFIIFNAEFIIFNAEFNILNTEFISLNTEFNIFNP